MKKIVMASLIGFLVGIATLGVTRLFDTPSSDGLPEASFGLRTTPVLAATENIPAQGAGFAPIVRKVKPAVVKVSTQVYAEQGRSPFAGDDMFERFFGRPQRRQPVEGLGSGFFISADGYIITNHHVVNNAVKITIETIDKKTYKAKKIGEDPKTDLALLKIEGTNHPFLEMGDAEKAEVGEWVLAIGNPLNQDLTVTSGIISAKGRFMNQLYQSGLQFQDFLQTDAAINQGNSGGPLINMQGQVIGINSVIVSNSGGSIGLGFAITSNLAVQVISDLKKIGRVIRGYLGVQIDEVDEEKAKEFDLRHTGIMIIHVEKNSPAHKAGLKRMDLITTLNGEPVKEFRSLQKKVASLKPGDKLTVGILRDDKPMTLTATVGESPESETIRPESEDGLAIDLGMVLIDNNAQEAERRNLNIETGIIVTQVERGGLAAQQGLRVNDVITGINYTLIRSVRQFRELIRNLTPGKSVYMHIDREGEERTLRFSIPRD
jgi:serine protease Do